MALGVLALTLATPPSAISRRSAAATSSVGARPAALFGAAASIEAGEAGLAQRLSQGVVADAPPDYRLAQTPVDVHSLPIDGALRVNQELGAIEALTATAAPTLGSLQWTFDGPTNIGGRVVDVAPDPLHAGTVYAATAGGGVWKSTDGGVTMAPAWPANLNQQIGSLAAAPDGTLYAGTGEANPGGGSITYGGTGIYKSTDGGVSWTLSGLPTSYAIGRIAVDPTNSNRVFAAAAGNLFIPGGERGLYRSIDAGNSWSLVLTTNQLAAVPTTGAIDVVVDPNNPLVVWASTWDHNRTPALRTYGGVGSGIWKSTDGGTTWSDLTTAFVDPSLTRSDIGRIGLAVAPSDSNYVYAIVIRTFGQFQGFYSTTDGGATTTWTKSAGAATVSSSQSSYGWWFGRLTVDPTNRQRVFAFGVSLSLSSNGGATWANVGTGHADHHSLVFDPTTAGRAYMGNDGGVEHSSDSGATWTRATYQPYTQFYSVGVSQQDPTRMVGGAQDNGANRSYSAAGSGSPPNGAWNSYVGGDGTETVINPVNQLMVFGCSQYGACSQFVTGGDGAGAPIQGVPAPTRNNWFSPIVLDPVDPVNVIYYAGDVLYQSTDAGATYVAISPASPNDLSGHPSVTDPFYPNYGTITTVAPASVADMSVLAGTDTGRVWFTHNPGPSATWTQSTDPSLPGAWVTRITRDPANVSVALATFSAFRTGVHTPYVMRTTDGGVHWVDISGNLPQAPVNDVLVVGGQLVVATDVGVFLTQDLGQHWYRVGQGLPLTAITDIEYVTSTQQLFAASFGRGMYSVTLGAPPANIPEAPAAGWLLAGLLIPLLGLRYRRGADLDEALAP